MSDTAFTNINKSRKIVRVRRAIQQVLPVLAIPIILIVADWLFWTQKPGISISFFLLALFFIRLAYAFPYRERKSLGLAGGIFVLGLVPLIEVTNPLTVVLALFNTTIACLILNFRIVGNWPQLVDNVVSLAIVGPFRFFVAAQRSGKSAVEGNLVRKFVPWILPLSLALGFVALFYNANPLIAQWVDRFDLRVLLALIFDGRVLFWLFVLWISWPLLEQNMKRIGLASTTCAIAGLLFSLNRKSKGTGGGEIQFHKRCLLLFNGVFAVQTMFDLTYLWGGGALPQGMTYASYAHRGAYPLVIAALLAGVFVLATMRPGGPGERSTLVKWLVLSWIFQNMLLLGSSLYRLDLYIDAYGLSYWRISAFIWMMLVAAGLGLIIVRFMTGRTTIWLLNANMITLYLGLYGASLLNFPAIIMNDHLQRYANSQLSRLHSSYLIKLGPDAYPVLLRHYQSIGQGREYASSRSKLDIIKEGLDHEVQQQLNRNWRSWSWRSSRALTVIQSATRLEGKVDYAP